MPSIADIALSGSLLPNLNAIQGETIIVLSGRDAGQSFVCVVEIEQDVTFDEGLGPDPRAKIIARFSDGFPIPNIESQDKIRTEDGLVWTAVLRPDNSYLSTDFELTQFIPVVHPGKTKRQAPVPILPSGYLVDPQGNFVLDPDGNKILAPGPTP